MGVVVEIACRVWSVSQRFLKIGYGISTSW